MRILQLKTEFNGRGDVKDVTFKLVRSSDKCYMYERSDGYFEVFKHKLLKYPKQWINEQEYTHIIYYPNSEAFGDWAWCFMTRDMADVKFDML